MTRPAGARRPLGSTYRLQLHGIGFAGARQLVGYLDDLGVQTLYVSPILAAREGSTHGYDVVDPTRLDPSLGSPEDFEDLLAALDRHGMRLLVDIVPNHQAVDPSNPWWWDVLRRGRESPMARCFDIDWAAQGGRVLLPELPEPLGALLSRGAFEVGVDRGGPVVVLGDRRYPLRTGAPDGTPGPGAGEGAEDVPALLARQHYRLAYWRIARLEGNYRRFFDVDGLVGVRVEDPAVYEATHELVGELAADRRIAGFRVDHVDGLADPETYLARLAGDLGGRRGGPATVLVEKILAAGESLPGTWPVDGTTGYELAAAAARLFVDSAGVSALARLGEECTGDRRTFAELVRDAKGSIVDQLFPAVLGRLGYLAHGALSGSDPGIDLGVADVTAALRALTIQLDVYRTYRGGAGRSAPGGRSGKSADQERIDRARIDQAAHRAASSLDEEGRRALQVVRNRMVEACLPAGTTTGGPADGRGDGEAAPGWVEVVRRWQQLTGAVMAKGVEDTAAYRYSGLVAQAEVGEVPEGPAVDPRSVLTGLVDRGRRHPSTLNAGSTHDSKRSADVRARLWTLSEAAGEWARLVRRWRRRHAPVVERRGGPDAHDELVAYQTCCGVWPVAGELPADLGARVAAALVKGAREAKWKTSWLDPDAGYEAALTAFVGDLFGPAGSTFRAEMDRFVARIGPAGATNSLAFVVLQAVLPGVPDLYQGSETWDFSLMDPDNRRPVAFDRLAALLAQTPVAGTAPGGTAPGGSAPDGTAPDGRAPDGRARARVQLDRWGDGRVKLHVVRSLLHLRAGLPALFDRGRCEVLGARGPMADHVVGLARHHGRHWVVAVVPRLVLSVAGPGRFPTGGEPWAGTKVDLPEDAPRELEDVLTGAFVRAPRRGLPVGAILDPLPVAVLAGRAGKAG